MGKLKNILKIREKSTYDVLKNQFQILYTKIKEHSIYIEDFLFEFEECILSNLILKIKDIHPKYLNKSVLFEKLNEYCRREENTECPY